MKKIGLKAIALMLAAANIISLAGCGAKQDDGKITLTLWTKLTQDAKPEDKESHDEWFAALQAKFPEVNFVEAMQPTGGDYRQEYDKALMAGTAPAFWAQFSYTDIPTRIENGTIADITKYVENWDLKKDGKVLTTFDDAISKDGKWYAIPHRAYTQGHLVNSKPLTDAGYDATTLPATWDEFAKMGAQITDLSVPRLGYALVGMDWCAWPFTAWVWSAGGEMVRQNDDGTYKIAFNEPQGVDAAEFMNQMIWNHKMTQKDVLMDLGAIDQLIFNQTAGFAWASFAALNKDNVEKYNLDVNTFSIEPLPSKDANIPRVSLAGGEVVTFNPKLSEEELAKAVEVAQYLYYSDEMLAIEFKNLKKNAIVDTNIPGRVDKYAEKLDSIETLTESMKKNLVDIAETAKPEPFCPHWSDLKTQLVAPLQKIYLTEGITRDEIQKELDACAEALYKAYPDTFKK